MREVLVARGIDEGKIAVIPNWANGDAIRPVARTENPLRRKWGLEGKFVVGYSGNLGRVHEFDTVLDAMTHLRGDDGKRFRSEEHTSELQSPDHLLSRLLLEKKKI